VLAVAVHEQNPAQARVIETGEQRRLLAEIARQHDNLNIEAIGGKRARCLHRAVAAAVVDIDHLGREPARLLERPRNLNQARVQRGDIAALVEQGHHNGKSARRHGMRGRHSGSGPDPHVCCHSSFLELPDNLYSEWVRGVILQASIMSQERRHGR